MEKESMKNVLVLGGTGAMGMYLVPELLKSGYKVFVTSRQKRISDSSNLVYLCGNANDLDWLANQIKNQEFIACFDFLYNSVAEFKNKSSRLLALSKQYFFISSYRSYSLCSTNVLKENNPLKSTDYIKYPILKKDRYGYNKAEEENFLQSLNSKNWTIIRPTMTFSKDRFQFFFGDNFDVSRAVRGVKTALPETVIHNRTNITYGKDVAKMLVLLVNNNLALGEVFHTVGNDTMTWGEIADIYTEVFGLEYTVVSDEDYKLACPDWMTMIDRFLDRPFSNEKILRVTGLQEDELTNLKNGLKEAWSVSDLSKFIISQDLVAQPKFDILTNDKTNLMFINPKIREKYKLRRETEEISFFTKIDNQFRICIEANGWYIKDSQEGKTTLAIQNVKDGQWLSFKFIDPLKPFEKRYINLTVESDNDVVLKPFVHFNGQHIKLLDAIRLYANQKQTISIEINVSNLEFPYSHFSITSTDFMKSTNLTFHNTKK